MASPKAIFLLVGFLDMISVGLILPHLDTHAKELGFSHIQIGLIGAVFSGCQMISSPIVGSLSDIRGRKPILLLCLIVCSLTYFWLGVTSSILTFLSLRAVLGIFKQTQLLTRALAPDYIEDPNEVASLYGNLLTLMGLGMALGPVISGHIIEAFPESGFTVLCAILSIIFVINTGLINLLPDILNDKKYESEAAPVAPKLSNSIVDALKEPVHYFCNLDWTKYWDIFLLKLLISLSMGLYYSNFSLFLKTEHDVWPKYQSFIISVQGILAAEGPNLIGFVNKKYTNDGDYSQRIFHIFLVIALSLLGSVVVPDVYLFIALIIPTGVCLAVSRVITLEVVIHRSVSGNRGTLIGASNIVESVAGILSPIIGTFINRLLGVAYTFLLGALFATIGVVISYQNRTKSLKEKNE